MAKKKLLASVALTAGLLGGGVAGALLGVPSVSGAQTTTVPEQPGNPEQPENTGPDDGATAPDTRAPRGDRENCPDKEGTEGEAPGSPSSNAGFGRGAGRV